MFPFSTYSLNTQKKFLVILSQYLEILRKNFDALVEIWSYTSLLLMVRFDIMWPRTLFYGCTCLSVFLFKKKLFFFSIFIFYFFHIVKPKQQQCVFCWQNRTLQEVAKQVCLHLWIRVRNKVKIIEALSDHQGSTCINFHIFTLLWYLSKSMIAFGSELHHCHNDKSCTKPITCKRWLKHIYQSMVKIYIYALTHT